jgi:hypothetical protein
MERMVGVALAMLSQNTYCNEGCGGRGILLL